MALSNLFFLELSCRYLRVWFSMGIGFSLTAVSGVTTVSSLSAFSILFLSETNKLSPQMVNYVFVFLFVIFSVSSFFINWQKHLLCILEELHCLVTPRLTFPFWSVLCDRSESVVTYTCGICNFIYYVWVIRCLLSKTRAPSF